MSDPRAVPRAIDALRRGWPVAVDQISILAIETADAAGLARFDAGRAADILLSGNRAAILKLANQREGAPTGPVRITRAPWLDLDAAVAVSDPALDLAHPLKGPFRTTPGAEADSAALRLARMAGLLPALFVGGGAEGAAASVSSEEIDQAAIAPDLVIASRAHLPVAVSSDAEIVAFRASDGGEHVALLFGAHGGEPPLVRLHSECLTGDALGSLKCDCGPQLGAALAAIAGSRRGILLYLRQEGRGIGLVNKLRAYALQDQGFDTVDANLRLGFADDERGFAVAARMLQLLGRDEVRLLTNNPRKVEGLEAAGVRVAERVPLVAGANSHNRGYLAAKRDRSGHQL